MNKRVVNILILLLVVLQIKIWKGDASLKEITRLKSLITKQNKELLILNTRNQVLAKEILNLKQYPEAIEEQARLELGMIKQQETYFQVVEPVN